MKSSDFFTELNTKLNGIVKTQSHTDLDESVAIYCNETRILEMKMRSVSGDVITAIQEVSTIQNVFLQAEEDVIVIYLRLSEEIEDWEGVVCSCKSKGSSIDPGLLN